MRIGKPALAVIAAASLLALSGCAGGGKGSSSSDPITIGWSLQLTGPVGAGSNYLVTAAQKAVDDINAKGGVKVGGSERKLKLKVLDNRSDVPTVTDQTRTLILDDKVDAMIGPVITDFSAVGAKVAEQYRVPYLVSSTPIDGFLAANKSGWNYSWDFFTSSPEQAKMAVAGFSKADTNKKVALFSDTTTDGVSGHAAYVKALKAAGFDIVADSTFPQGNTDFSAAVQKAKDAGADISIAYTFPADGANLLKEFKAQGYMPKLEAFPKAADGEPWPGAAGALGIGALGTGTWGVNDRGPGADALATYFDSKSIPVPLQAQGAEYYALVQIYAAAVEKAGTTDKAKVNAEIGKISVDTVAGKAKFTSKHVDEIPVMQWQWQGTTDKDMSPVQVYPAAGKTLVTPPPGLAG